MCLVVQPAMAYGLTVTVDRYSYAAVVPAALLGTVGLGLLRPPMPGGLGKVSRRVGFRRRSIVPKEEVRPTQPYDALTASELYRRRFFAKTDGRKPAWIVNRRKCYLWISAPTKLETEVPRLSAGTSRTKGQSKSRTRNPEPIPLLGGRKAARGG